MSSILKMHSQTNIDDGHSSVYGSGSEATRTSRHETVSSQKGHTQSEKVLTLLVIILSVALATVVALYIIDMKKIVQAGSSSSSPTTTLAPDVNQATTLPPDVNQTTTLAPNEISTKLALSTSPKAEPSIPQPTTTTTRTHHITSTLTLDENEKTTSVPQGFFAAAKQIDQSIDYGVMPCDDFYKFSCGRWLKDLESRKISTHNFLIEIQRRILFIVRDLLEQPVKEGELPIIQKTKLFYHACIDIGLYKKRVTYFDKDSISERGVVPLKEFLIHKLGGWPLTHAGWDEANFDLVNTLTKINLLSRLPIVKFLQFADSKDNSKRRLIIDQPAFVMPDRSYYLANRNDKKLMAYEELITFVATVLGLADTTTAAKDVKAVVDFEIKLAQISASKHENVDRLTYNPMTLEDVQANYSKIFNWTRYVYTLMSTSDVLIDISSKEIILNKAPLYFQKLTDVINNTPKRTIANYIIWTFVYSIIDKRVVGSIFNRQLAQYNQALYGSLFLPDMKLMCTLTTLSVFSLSVGRMFVEKHFDPEAKVIALDMIAELKKAFSELLEESDWLDEKTKQYAEEKKRYMVSKIGYPDYIYNDTYIEELYSMIKVDERLFENIISALRFEYVVNLRELRKPFNKDEWIPKSTSANAHYLPSNNEIVFPAGILQPPFYNKVFPKSINFGGIGMVIGHEMIHGFDDTGRHYDKVGNLYNWWSPDAEEKFKTKTHCLIDQYGNFVLEPSKIKADGVRTIGENIADNGGLRQAFRAYRNWVKSQGHEETKLPGLNFTHNQIFFISFAQICCTKQTDAASQNHIKTKPHSLAEFRVNGAVQNSKDFNEAFNCPVESKMNPTKKCQVW